MEGSGHYYSSGYQGGGGAAGRIAVYFALNRTFSGSFEAHGGSSGGANAGHGGPGTMFFYHTGTYTVLNSIFALGYDDYCYWGLKDMILNI